MQAKHHKKDDGFTLVELLVVLFIISMMLKISFLATGDWGKQRKVRAETEQILEVLHYAQSYALLYPARLRLKIDATQMMCFIKTATGWQTITSDPILRKRNFSHPFKILKLDKKRPLNDIITDPNDNMLYVSSTGKIQAFTLLLKYQQALYKLSVNQENKFHFSRQ